MVFTLDDGYLLTDYEAPYHFVIPQSTLLEGVTTLGARALLRDDVTTEPVEIVLEVGAEPPATRVEGFVPRVGPGVPAATPRIVAAVGDGASGRESAAQVVDLIDAIDPDLLFYLGDVYEQGTFTEFMNWYDGQGTLWGRFRSITNPVLGNHEQIGGTPDGYEEYWGAPPRYYRVDVDGWTFLVLDVQRGSIGDQQLSWLTDELATSSACTIVFQHHPLLSVGPHGFHPQAAELWTLMASFGVDAVIAGHDHNYQRWLPLNADQAPDSQGPIQIVAGAGGHGVRPANRSDDRVATVMDDAVSAVGAVQLELNDRGMGLAYRDTSGRFVDFTARTCSGAGPDTIPPTSPPEVSGVAPDGGRVELSWHRAYDDGAVAGYRVERNGRLLTVVDSPASSYTDDSVEPNSLYQYSVRAVDLAGNLSSEVDPIYVATGDPASVIVLRPVADSYVNAAEPSLNYGNVAWLRVDGAPAVTSLIRFEVPDLAGPVVAATLRLRAESPVGVGYAISLTESAWSESGITFRDLAGIRRYEVARSMDAPAGTWSEVDVTGAIDAPGVYTFVVEGITATNYRLSSREGLHPPELIIQIDVSDS